MEKILFAWISFLLLSVSVFGQSVDCSNIGFEEGTTKWWILTNGRVVNTGSTVIYANETVGIYANSDLATKLTDGNDPRITAAAVPIVAPGSTSSLRLEQTATGSRFDRAKISQRARVL